MITINATPLQRTRITLYYKDVLAPKTGVNDLKDTKIKFMTADSIFIRGNIESIDAVNFANKDVFKIEMIVRDSALNFMGLERLATVNISYKEAIKTYIRHIPSKFGRQAQLAAHCLCRKREEKVKKFNSRRR